MKSRSREINIFSMSALDLFASALGAFILIAVALFPYFPNTGDSPERVAEVRAQLERVQRELQQAQSELQASRAALDTCRTQSQQIQAALDTCEEQLRASADRAALEAAESALAACRSEQQQVQDDLESCEREARKKFVLVVISWGARDDVDLHVVDPAGREFYYGNRSVRGSRAKLEEDNTRGPGNEIWLHPAAEPGTYRVYYNYFRQQSDGGVRVRGAVLTPRGRTELPTQRLRREDDKPLVATITVDSEGVASISAR